MEILHCIWNALSGEKAAAWVQAVGSILAIVAAFRVAGAQQKAQQRREMDADRRVQALVFQLAARLVHYAETQVKALHARNHQALQSQTTLIRELVSFGESIPIERIPAAAISAFLSVRQVLKELAAEDHEVSHSSQVRWQHHHDTCAGLLNQAIEHRAILQASFVLPR